MANSLGNDIENEVLDQLFGAEAYTAPATLYFALFSVTPSDAGGGTEFTAGNYARKSMDNNKTTWTSASSGALSNNAAITFAQCTGTAWGTAVAMGIFDASTSGTLIAWGTLNTSKSIDIGDTASFAAGEIDITMD